ncbi:uncharacterized protein LOC128954610 [Oppia nitens]|uniref:uncharacterized protein LOC128954610 n=1 Tax=Oppia nitens TaxID=1686743 RepID=UPI0023DC4996|nr:uncharacterized protein LOC128954610 [Oppia nitens]
MDENAQLIRDRWPPLPNDIDIAFTVEQSTVQGNPLAGHTVFVKNQTYYEFDNRQFISSGDISFWEMGRPADQWKYVITFRDTNLVLINVWDPFRKDNKGHTLYFDHNRFPETLSHFDANIDSRVPWHHLRQLFPMPGSDDKYVALLRTHGQGFYCIMNDLFDNCNYRPIHEVFNCSAQVLLTKQNNWIYWVWLKTRLNMNELLMVMSGAILATVLVIVLIAIVSTIRFIQLS